MSVEPSQDIVETDDEDLDVSPLLTYLETSRGHELASRVVGIFEGIQRATLETNSKHATLELTFKVVTVVCIIFVAGGLTYFDKFNPTMGVLLGTLLGYVFGKKS